MNRFDRVTATLVLLQTRSVVTARELADRFDVSERTVYRDLRSLENAGIPIGAAPGLGHFLDKAYRLPPVAFTREEAASLLLGARMVEHRVDERTRAHHLSALDKVRSVATSADREYLDDMDGSVAAHRPAVPGGDAGRDAWLPECRAALSGSRVVRIRYASGASGEATERRLEPIGLCHYAEHWHLIAWCRLRADYRDFRLDRIEALHLEPERFERRARDSLRDYLARRPTRELHEITVDFTADAARFVGDKRHDFGLVRETETGTGVAMTFLTPHLEYLARWLLQFGAGASSRSEALRPVMAGLVAELRERWADDSRAGPGIGPGTGP